MADFAGNVLAGLIFPNATDDPAFGNMPVPDYTLPWDVAYLLEGTKGSTQPVSEFPRAIGGNRWNGTAFLDIYNRLWVDPLRVDLGNVVSAQQRSVSLWNAFFVPRTLNQVTATGDDGVELTLPSAPPFEFAPLEQIFGTFAISTEGPPTVDATFTFDFDVADFVVHVVGIRIVAWTWEINWLDPLLERLEWKTDVQESYNGTEYRAELRSGPRTEWEFTFDVAEDQRRLFENVVFGWGARAWALPVWIDVSQLTEELPQGSTFIEVDTEGKDYEEEGLAIVIGPDQNYEAMGIETVSDGGLTLQDPTIATWPVGSRIYPARSARLLDPRATARFHRNYARGLARFRSDEEIDRPELLEQTYRSKPVMVREMNWREAPDIDYQRKIDTVDFEIGKLAVVDESDIAAPVHRFIYTGMTRADSDYLRRWLYSRRGRFKGIWMPTWCDDLILATNIAEGAGAITVEACGIVSFTEEKPHRRDIRVQLKDGTVYYRRVTDPTKPVEGHERLVLNESFPGTIFIEDVERISWMHYVRLDTDTIEITWQNPEFCECVLTLRGPRNEF